MRTLFTILFALSSLHSMAQEVEGMVIHDKTLKPIGDVLVANKRTSETAYSDSNGRYRISAVEGDLLLFYRIGYKSRRETAHIVRGKMTTVAMTTSELQLDEVQVKGNNYRMDSIERSIIYRKALNDASEKITISTNNGIVINGIFGKLASIITGREKRLKHFKDQFLSDEQSKFIDTRYNAALVKRLTGLTGDDATIFMNTYPMPYEFARTATELELQVWVRNNFKQYSNKRK